MDQADYSFRRGAGWNVPGIGFRNPHEFELEYTPNIQLGYPARSEERRLRVTVTLSGCVHPPRLFLSFLVLRLRELILLQSTYLIHPTYASYDGKQASSCPPTNIPPPSSGASCGA